MSIRVRSLMLVMENEKLIKNTLGQTLAGEFFYGVVDVIVVVFCCLQPFRVFATA